MPGEAHGLDDGEADERDDGGMGGVADFAGQLQRAAKSDAQNAFDRLADQKEFGRIVDAAISGGHGQGCILLSNLDRFRELNDLYGHDTGDAVMWNAVHELYAHFTGCACIARAGGDIFMLWIPDMSKEAVDDVRRLVGMVNDRLLHPDKELPPVSVSVGAAFYEEGDDCRTLGKKANRMLYFVKENGRCGCEIYDGRQMT